MQHAQLLVSGTEWTPEKYGEITGGTLVLVIQLLGIAKCVQIMRRETTSRLCVSALLLVLIGWFLSSLGAALGMVSQAAAGPVKALLGVLTMLFMLAALVLGIIGLATYDKIRFVQGRAQAIWAVVLSGLMMLFFIGALAVGAMRAMNARGGGPDLTGTPRGNAPIAKPEFNFSITPSARWINMNPVSFNKIACLAMRHSNPRSFSLSLASARPVPWTSQR